MSCLCHVTLFFVFFFILLRALFHFTFCLPFSFLSFFFFFGAFCVCVSVFICLEIFHLHWHFAPCSDKLQQQDELTQSPLEVSSPPPTTSLGLAPTRRFMTFTFMTGICVCLWACVCVPLFLYASVKSSWNINLLFYCVYAACAALHDLWALTDARSADCDRITRNEFKAWHLMDFNQSNKELEILSFKSKFKWQKKPARNNVKD